MQAFINVRLENSNVRSLIANYNCLQASRQKNLAKVNNFCFLVHAHAG